MASPTLKDYPFLNWSIQVIADFLRVHARRRVASNELTDRQGAERPAITRDLPARESQSRYITAAKDETPHLLAWMLDSLGKAMPPSNDPLARDLRTACSSCRKKRRCNRELAAGRAPTSYRTFCPNAARLDLLPASARLMPPSFRSRALCDA